MNKMKKSLAAFMSVAMLFSSTSLSVFAEEAEQTSEEEISEAVEETLEETVEETEEAVEEEIECF